MDSPTHNVLAGCRDDQSAGYDNTTAEYDHLRSMNGELQAGVGYDPLQAGMGYNNLPAVYEDLRAVHDNIQAGMGNDNYHTSAGPLYDNRVDPTTFSANVHYDNLQAGASDNCSYGFIAETSLAKSPYKRDTYEPAASVSSGAYAPIDSLFYSFSNPAY